MTISLTHIQGIGSSTTKILADNGFESVHQLASSTITQLTKVPGFGAVRANRVISAAIELLTAADDSTAKAAQ
ncbi:MAG: helix-hairpin-helix domain-containing protein, partial [Gammaproteobacteria bacterium]|nr:helix-hairpin-helix domain-containing protein [Gammaproteobacteria bacterium]